MGGFISHQLKKLQNRDLDQVAILCYGGSVIKKQKYKKFVILTVLIGLFIWLGLVNPTSGPPLTTLVPFILLFVLLYWLFSWTAGKFGRGVEATRSQKSLSLIFSLIVTVLLVLSSLKQLDTKDWIILLALAAAGCFYILKIMPRANTD